VELKRGIQVLGHEEGQTGESLYEEVFFIRREKKKKILEKKKKEGEEKR